MDFYLIHNHPTLAQFPQFEEQLAAPIEAYKEMQFKQNANNSAITISEQVAEEMSGSHPIIWSFDFLKQFPLLQSAKRIFA